MTKAAPIASSILLVATLISASVRALSEEATASQGQHFALLACAPCHVVATNQEAPPILRNPGPSFVAIANRPETTADSLSAFLSTTHAKIATPTGMPNPRLAEYQMVEVISYILSLRHKN
jgi:cytochrome c2